MTQARLAAFLAEERRGARDAGVLRAAEVLRDAGLRGRAPAAVGLLRAAVREAGLLFLAGFGAIISFPVGGNYSTCGLLNMGYNTFLKRLAVNAI
jgi:hypothetical protein